LPRQQPGHRRHNDGARQDAGGALPPAAMGWHTSIVGVHKKAYPLSFVIVAIACLTLALFIGHRIVNPAVVPPNVHLGNQNCGSVFTPHPIGPVYWNGLSPPPKYHVEACEAARRGNFLATISFVTAAGCLFLAAFVVFVRPVVQKRRRAARRPPFQIT
jgi:hypothetical protein